MNRPICHRCTSRRSLSVGFAYEHLDPAAAALGSFDANTSARDRDFTVQKGVPSHIVRVVHVIRFYTFT